MTVNEIVAQHTLIYRSMGPGASVLTDASLTMESVEIGGSDTSRTRRICILPTVITAIDETIAASLSALRMLYIPAVAWLVRCLVFTWKGPFISAEDGPRGAHPRNHVQTG